MLQCSETARAAHYLRKKLGVVWMIRAVAGGLAVVLAAGLGGCGDNYSPNTYSTVAVQQVNKVDRGVVVGVRRVDVSAPGVVGAAAGAAAGGAVGSQATGGGVGSALGAVGGALLGGLVGTEVEHAADDTFAYEYIVRKTSGDLLSVTQKDTTPLAIGTKVLVIEGKQARIVTDYTVDAKPAAPAPAPKPLAEAPTSTAPAPPPVVATPLPPLALPYPVPDDLRFPNTAGQPAS
jgi:outer membrane lipoprotein SlyB